MLHGEGFDQVGGRSVLVDFRNSILDRDAVLSSGGASLIRRRAGGLRNLLRRLENGTNRVIPHFASSIIEEVKSCASGDGRRPLILVVGGGSVGRGADALYESREVDIASFDIYWSDNVTFLADGHAIPFAAETVDGVWIQAVLEHVIDPSRVVAEIHRVLRHRGVVFADTPFMWPVHEKAYDFTRWSPSGHRWLFRDFEVIEAGASSGPGRSFALATEYLVSSLTRSAKVGRLAALLFSWVRLLDRYCDDRRGLDAAAGIFFFGRKAGRALEMADAVRYYDEQVALQRRVRALRGCRSLERRKNKTCRPSGSREGSG